MNGIECRIASLRAFMEARDRQLELSFSDCGDDDRQDGGRFGPGNDCGGGAAGGSEESSSGAPYERTGFPPSFSGTEMWDRPAAGASSLKVSNPGLARSIASDMGISGISHLLTVGVATAKGVEVDIEPNDNVRWTSRGDTRFRRVRISSYSPVEGTGGGQATTEVSLRNFEGQEPYVYYDYFQVDQKVRDQIRLEKAESGDGLSKTERRVSAALIGQMLESLAAADDAGIKIAKTSAAGSPGDSMFAGYRLWGRFGFDGNVEGEILGKFLQEISKSDQNLLPATEASIVRSTGEVTLQQVLSTKAGERWWSKNGEGMDMKLDFSKKDSLGYKRFRDLLDKHRRAKKRGEGRDYLEFIDFVRRSHLGVDLDSWPGFAKAERRNCGTGSGGFQKGNTCSGQAVADVATGAAKGAVIGAAGAVGKTGGFPPAVAAGAATGAAVGAVKGLYDNRMRPTRAGKAIKAIGTSDEQVASMVKGLGGSPKSIAEADGKSAVTLSIKGKDGKSQFDVRMTKSEVRIKPASGRQNLTAGDIKQIKKIAEENSPKSVKVVVDAVPTSVLAKVVKAGASLAVDATGALVAAFVVPSAPAIAGTAIEATTGIDIEKTKAAQWVGEKVLGNLPKRR
jgi:hypothetical protein